MARRKKTEEVPLDKVMDLISEEHNYYLQQILEDHPGDENEKLRDKLGYEVGMRLQDEYARKYPSFAREFGHPGLSKAQQKPKRIQGNIGLDIEAKKYD